MYHVKMFADYTCNSCSVSVKTLKGYVQHQGLHRNEAHYLYACCMAGCKLRFRNYNAFKCHVYRHHRQSSSGLCRDPSHVKLHLSDLLGHLKFPISKRERVHCPFKNCDRSFSRPTYLESTNTLQLCMSLVHTVFLQFLVSLSSLLLKTTQVKGQMTMGMRRICYEEFIHEKSVHVFHEVAGKAPDPFLNSTVNRRRDK